MELQADLFAKEEGDATESESEEESEETRALLVSYQLPTTHKKRSNLPCSASSDDFWETVQCLPDKCDLDDPLLKANWGSELKESYISQPIKKQSSLSEIDKIDVDETMKELNLIEKDYESELQHVVDKIDQISLDPRASRNESQLDFFSRDSTTTTEGTFTCDTCPFETNNEYILSWHVQFHEKDLSCGCCGYTGENKEDLIEHQYLTHEEYRYANEPPAINKDPAAELKCSACPYVTNTSRDLTLHKLKEHTISIITCDQCDFKTVSQEHLDMHKVANTGVVHGINYDRKYDNTMVLRTTKEVINCEQCEFQTSSQELLDAHLLTNCGVDRKVKCDKCEFETFCRELLDAHLLTDCVANPAQEKRAKKEQEKADDNAEEHKCSECSYITNTLNDLELHKITNHTTEEVLRCSKCNFWTTDWKCLEMHVLASLNEAHCIHKNIGEVEDTYEMLTEETNLN